jgi:hypothetical protein
MGNFLYLHKKRILIKSNQLIYKRLYFMLFNQLNKKEKK